MKTIDAAVGKWPMILRAMGMDSHDLNGRHHPCPSTGEGKDCFRFSDHNGFGLYFCKCSPDGRKNGMDLLKCKTGREFGDLAKEIDQLIGNTDRTIEKPNRHDPMPLLKSVQSRSRKAALAVSSYLEGRGLICPPSLREIHNLEYWDDGQIIGKYSAMLGLVVDAKGDPQSWHVTYLQDGMKANVPNVRKVLPPVSSVSGCAIRLFPVAEHIGVAEGIETAIAAHMLHGLPVWSCMNKGGVASFVPPPEVKRVSIFGDNDASFGGQAAAYKLAERLTASKQKIKATVYLPSEIGDFCDVLRNRR